LSTYDTGCDPAIEAVNASHPGAPDTFRIGCSDRRLHLHCLEVVMVWRIFVPSAPTVSPVFAATVTTPAKGAATVEQDRDPAAGCRRTAKRRHV